jgi:RNA polymerase sigma-54 factor
VLITDHNVRETLDICERAYIIYKICAIVNRDALDYSYTSSCGALTPVMKQSLQLRLGQQLTMTPQLQQAIRMLQLSTLELQQEIQQALESNLMLEEIDEGEEIGESPAGEEQESPYETPSRDEVNEAENAIGSDYPEERAPTENDAIPEELPVDSAWEDIYESAPTGSSGSSGEEREFDYGDTTSESLRAHLLWQMQMMPLSDTDILIAETIIDAIGEDGFLTSSLEELLAGLQQHAPEIELDEVEAVLHTVQNFEPAGVAARDLRESLLLQLRALPTDTPWLEQAQALLHDHFELLAGRDYNQLKRVLKLSDDELARITQLIQSLNPRPGGQISNSKPEYIVPDIMVSKVKGSWRVELNPDASPRLRINHHYASLIRQMNGSESSTLKNHLQEARWFIKSLQSRNETLLRVATSIVEHQRDFLEEGEVAMKPMVLHDIAEELGMHESTISRTTTRKYMHTPRGIFELKYFFSSHVGTASGGECSSTAIRAMIKQLIAEEPPTKPLSDSKIADILSAKGINVARRTVAKYREAMAIAPSNERKRLA